jgi:hypothetical protein
MFFVLDFIVHYLLHVSTLIGGHLQATTVVYFFVHIT